MLCVIENCGAKAIARGWCERHYRRWRVYGDPLKALKPKKREGETVIDTDGYLRRRGNIHIHRDIAEATLGRPLHPGEVVHHIDGDRLNNDPANLEIIPSIGEHTHRHAMERAEAACGHANWRKCRICHQYDDPAKMRFLPRINNFLHRECDNRSRRERKRRAKAH